MKKLVATLAICLFVGCGESQTYPIEGRTATPEEVERINKDLPFGTYDPEVITEIQNPGYYVTNNIHCYDSKLILNPKTIFKCIPKADFVTDKDKYFSSSSHLPMKTHYCTEVTLED